MLLVRSRFYGFDRTLRLALQIAAMLLVLLHAASGWSAGQATQKIVMVDSYHRGYAWGDGIVRGVRSVLNKTEIVLKTIHMDTKRNTSEAFKKNAAARAKAVIDAFDPDLIIAADDNASKYLIVPYYKNTDLPVVFCGINWDAGEYGFPASNVTGMLEVTPIPQLIDLLRPMARGDTIGFLGPDILTARKEVHNYLTVFGIPCVTHFAKDVEDWKKGFIALQEKAQMLIVASHGGLYAEHEAELVQFVERHTKIPTGACYDFMAPFALLTYGKIAEEQGVWAATTALSILEGAGPASIPLARNEKGQIIVNGRIAEAIDARLPYEIIEWAEKVIQ